MATITGTSSFDFLNGTASSDEISGLDDDDVLFGWGGADTLIGGNGSDTMIGGGGRDSISGGEGNDFLIGLSGADSMVGGSGNDTYAVDVANDVVREARDGGIDTVRTSISFNLRANFENLLLTGAGSIDGRGNDAANTLNGNRAANELSGRGGNDTISGGNGNDTLKGGGGSDEFLFKTALNATTNVDHIEQFAGNDLIDLDDAVFTGIGATLDPGEFRVGASAADANDRIIYDSSTGALFFDMDGVGGATQIQFATLTSAFALSNADFQMV